MPLCRCSVLYQATKRVTQTRAVPAPANGRLGYTGVCFRVRKSDSEYGLSLLTCGRLNDGTMPSHCSIASIVEPRMGLPLSECRIKPAESTPDSTQMFRMRAAA